MSQFTSPTSAGASVTSARNATAIADGLKRRGYQTEIYSWTSRDRELFDVYVTALESMSDAAEVASTLSDEGWETDITLLPTRS